MSQKVFMCNGCLNHFSNKGYSLHLLQTTNPTCKQIYLDSLRSIPDSDPIESASRPDSSFTETKTNIDTVGLEFGQPLDGVMDSIFLENEQDHEKEDDLLIDAYQADYVEDGNEG